MQRPLPRTLPRRGDPLRSPPRRVALAVVVLSLGLGVGSCAPRPRTELVIGLATDLVAPYVDDPLVRVQLTAWRPPNADTPLEDKTWDVAGAAPSLVLPGSFAIYTSDGS